MKPDRSIDIHFTTEDWERIERDWTAWLEGELDRPLVMVESLAAEVVVPQPQSFTSNYPLSMDADDVLDEYQVSLEARRYHGDAFPKWWPNFGPGIMAGFLGADVNSTPETVWFSPGEMFSPEAGKGPAEFDLKFDPSNVWWQRVLDLTRRAIERWGGQVAVAHTDIGGNLDILASLMTTERLLFALHDDLLLVEKLSRDITSLWLRYYDELYKVIAPAGRGTTPWAAIWSPGRCYMLQSDFSYMISPSMFERFVLPDLAACCEALDHAFYHLDGKGQIPHLDMLLSLDRLAGIQWIPGDGAPPPEEWLPLLKRIRDAGKLCQVYVSATGALRIIRELGGRGFAFAILDRMSSQEAEDFIRLINRQGDKV